MDTKTECQLAYEKYRKMEMELMSLTEREIWYEIYESGWNDALNKINDKIQSEIVDNSTDQIIEEVGKLCKEHVNEYISDYGKSIPDTNQFYPNGSN